MSRTVAIIVCAEDPLARAGLAAMLGAQPDCVVTLQADLQFLTAEEPLEETDSDGVVIWDVGWNGVEDGQELAGLDMPVIALVGDEEQAIDAWNAGCRGLLWRATPPADIAIAAHAAQAGLVVLAPGLANLTNRESRPGPENTAEELTTRETEVLELVAQGLTNKAIGHRLAISEHTVKFHINAILGKLNAQSRTDAVVKATRQGLISL